MFLLVAALGLAIPRYGQPSDAVVVDFADRVRIILAVLLKGVGGGLTLHAGDVTDADSGLIADAVGTTTISLVPLSVTFLWIGALYLGLRGLRTRITLAATAPGGSGAGIGAGAGAGATAGLEAAVRVSLSVAAGVLLLALFAQPSVAGVAVSSSPVLAALGALVLSLVASAAVLCHADAARWLSGRPAAYALLHATSTALRALAVVLVLGAIAAFIALTQIDDLDEQLDLTGSGVSPLLAALLVVPNLAVAALGLGWGAPLKATAGGSAASGGSYETESFGFSRLADAAGSGAVVGALALGLVCALTVALLAARRSPGRGGQLLAAGIFFVLFLSLAAIGGFGVEATDSATAYDSGGSGSIDAGLSVPDALLFGLLWLGAAVFVAPYLRGASGHGTPGGGTPAGGPPPPAPAAGNAPAPGAGTAWNPAAVPPNHPVVPAPAPPSDAASGTPPTAPPPYGGTAPRSRAVVWVAILAAAFLVGGGAAAGILLWQDHHGRPAQDQPAPAASSTNAADRPDQLRITS